MNPNIEKNIYGMDYISSLVGSGRYFYLLEQKYLTLKEYSMKIARSEMGGNEGVHMITSKKQIIRVCL